MWVARIIPIFALENAEQIQINHTSQYGPNTMSHRRLSFTHVSWFQKLQNTLLTLAPHPSNRKVYILSSSHRRRRVTLWRKLRGTGIMNPFSTPSLYFKRFNSLVAGRCCCNFVWLIFKPILRLSYWNISRNIDLRWMQKCLTDIQLILVQVVAWCRQTTGHYLNQS